MANLEPEGNKTVICRNGHSFEIPFKTTVAKCPYCDLYIYSAFYGTVMDKYGNNIPK